MSVSETKVIDLSQDSPESKDLDEGWESYSLELLCKRPSGEIFFYLRFFNGGKETSHLLVPITADDAAAMSLALANITVRNLRKRVEEEIPPSSNPKKAN